MDKKKEHPEMRIPLQTAVEVSDWPCSTSHDPHSGLGMVLGMLAVLGLSSVTLILFLWQGATSFTSHRMFPEEVPSWSWETLKGDAEQQNNSCQLILVESIPEDLPFAAGSPTAQPLAQAWLQLLDTARESVHIASYYWSLTGLDIGVNDSSSRQGEALLQKFQQLLLRNISVVVATHSPTLAKTSTDLQVLAAHGAQIRQVPMKQLTGGVLHSKFWVVDGRHIYVGSANMDWRSLTQKTQVGVSAAANRN